MLRKWSGFSIAAAFAILVPPSYAQAQSCSSLKGQLSGNSGTALGIAVDYPKTHIAILTCMVGSDGSSEASGCAVAMIVAACFGMSGEECNDLGYRWKAVADTYKRITAQMREQGCHP